MRSVVYLLSLLVFSPPTALRGRNPSLHHVQMTGQSHANCFCRAQGRMFAYGESVCLEDAGGAALAQCQMELNVTSWTDHRAPVPGIIKNAAGTSPAALAFDEILPAPGNQNQKTPTTMAQMKASETHTAAIFSLEARSK